MLVIFDLDDTLFPCLPDDYSEEDLQKIQLFPSALDLLKKDDLIKILVTKGNPDFQNKKINLLEIRDHFSKIMICATNEEKKTCFQKIMEEYQDDNAWIIGDKINSEIRWGNELNINTIQIKQGKHKDLKAQNHLEIPDYEIETFPELWGLLKLKP